ncbi:MAG: class I SAM-dependent methyltransferase [Oligoflexia bacterium]|nr:class I SAM-dependent methyltransferase [Oligoflexia bacterium]
MSSVARRLTQCQYYRMILKEFSNALILDKPSGASTHTPDGGVTEGFLEMAQRLFDRTLWAVHRLDHGTSGCLLVTTSKEAVMEWTQKLKSAKKKYIFISPHESKESVWKYEGRIEKTGNHRFELVEGISNSFTKFAKLGTSPFGFLYEAEISSGKTHQIRIHAQASGIPILGDAEHGGNPFVRLMLHSKSLDFEGEKYISPLPTLFIQKEKPDTDHAKFLSSYDRRRFLINFEKKNTDSFRLVHREWTKNFKPKLCIEKLGDVLQFQNYTEKTIQPHFAQTLTESIGCKKWFIRTMKNRGLSVALENNNINSSIELPDKWVITENKIKFEMRSNQGLSTGLFLDQRENRKKVLQSSEGKRVANFFSYTCGFSLAAALGGAHEVISIDTSGATLDWGKCNFKLNGLNPDQYDFFVADSIFFLKACLKRERQFDLIIIDPPTFSRHKHGVFNLNENLDELLDFAFKCLAPHGRLLFTLNDESITSQFLGRRLELSVERTIKKVIRLERCHPPYDFEFPLERNTVMKGFWIYL